MRPDIQATLERHAIEPRRIVERFSEILVLCRSSAEAMAIWRDMPDAIDPEDVTVLCTSKTNPCASEFPLTLEVWPLLSQPYQQEVKR